MNDTIEIDEKKVYMKRYRVRPTGTCGSTLETSIPREAFERECRGQGLTVEEGLEKLDAVWRFDSFKGLHLTFEPAKKWAQNRQP
jgi:hypothetical protein